MQPYKYAQLILKFQPLGREPFLRHLLACIQSMETNDIQRVLIKLYNCILYATGFYPYGWYVDATEFLNDLYTNERGLFIRTHKIILGLVEETENAQREQVRLMKEERNPHATI